ncbi:MAG TPA: HesA/MoeB/ThiF family protein [Candidatus Dormibacteraeota bacterium]|nr:HesA/MoeB/ThiF family protein [Candidatus Dormibacteraeota bacterium]
MALEADAAGRLGDDDVERYSRQLILDGVGEAGQHRLAAASVLVVGAGALGSPVVQYLAAAGVGEIEIWDGDEVEPSNLNRQPLHTEGDLGQSKAQSAAAAGRRLNSSIRITGVARMLTGDEMAKAVQGRAAVCDASDDFETKFRLNDACLGAGVPLVHAAILEFGGQLTTITEDGPCLRCLFGEPPPDGEVPTCAQAGILGPVAAVIGGMQAVEAMKLVLGVGDPLSGRLLVYDALRPRARAIDFPRDPRCPAPHRLPAADHPRASPQGDM